MKETIAIVMECQPLERDDPETNLICKALDGSYHRVMARTAAIWFGRRLS